MSELARWAWHIEISSKCTLHCPRCPRQEHPESLTNTELSLDFFKQNFTPLFVHKNVEKIMFCGNDGDPIYAHELIPVVAYFKKIKPRMQITIITNGSYKKPEWWAELGQVLNGNDRVIFSIDGYDNNSNRKYRVNSDWDSIMQGIVTLRANSECSLIWSAIPFAFNQNHLEQMESLAKELGMNTFELSYSSKFGEAYAVDGVDPLEPSAELTSIARYGKKTVTFVPLKSTNTAIEGLIRSSSIKPTNNIMPACSSGTGFGLYIDAAGRFFPCCWVATRYPHNAEWQNIGNVFNLKITTLEKVLADNFWKEEFQTYHWQECQTKCAVAQGN